ncbi:Mth938-like domain-containing protein [Gymnodinialimonas ceratoperidinii]|uniref:Mth938-like domain-containing protein n=1 Tax=Gymnodinialimonas ceratoperidinii TaxID=2856823 RepID=A0A8F6Y9S1_9RHOB|nr:Mth938-like domain-containing protein [Gymnodinialimonas ceratoperidinii]QXT39234.1 Mth938-like domain-containing protein [Gymnodinialimonas ceratoperidinii]
MRMNEVEFDDSRPVDGYGPGFFRVGGEKFDGAVLLLPSGPASWGGFEDASTLVAAAGEVDVLLLGTGAEIAHPPAALRRAVEAAGLGLEVMASSAACRTYNVLLAEGRRVGAAMLPV